MRRTSDGLEARLGQTLLTLHEDPRAVATDHFALDVPDLPAARTWLHRRGIPLLDRQGRAARSEGPSVRRISEVGIAADDVPAARRRLEPFGIGVYGDLAHEDFAPVGSIEGLLILVTVGRVRMPTEHSRAVPAPLDIEVSGPLGLDLTIGSARLRSIGRYPSRPDLPAGARPGTPRRGLPPPGRELSPRAVSAVGPISRPGRRP